MTTKMTTEKCQKMPKTYTCEVCNFICSKKSNFTQHLLTDKHKRQQMTTEKCQKMPKNATPQCRHICEYCEKEYADRVSLWRHKKKCTQMMLYNDTIKHDKSNEPTGTDSSPDLVMMLVKQNQEFKDLIISQNQQIVELSKNTGSTMSHSHNNNTNNSHNKTFNLQFFLNETCKDAMNITDFVNSLKLTLQDLEQVGELGYAEGISRMFVKGLNDLDVTKRPIHCSDLKREVIHIKDQDKWEKDESKERLTKAIKDVSTKNLMLLGDWQKENPGCTEYNHSKNDIYLKIMTESCGPTDTTTERRDFAKIMKKVAKNTIVDRENHWKQKCQQMTRQI